MADKKMSEYSPISGATAAAQGYRVLAFKGGAGNGGVPLSDLAGICSAGALTDAASINVPNNSLSTLTTAQSALTLNVNLNDGELPNFAVEITAAAAVTLTVTKTVGSESPVTLRYADAAGNALESGKFYQLTCVGSCWTVAEFVDPTAVVASVQSPTPKTRGLPLSGNTQEEPLEGPQESVSEEAVEEQPVDTDEPSASDQANSEGTEPAEPTVTGDVTEPTQEDNGGDAR